MDFSFLPDIRVGPAIAINMAWREQLSGHDQKQRKILMKQIGKVRKPILVSILVLPLQLVQVAIADYPIAGIEPATRPADAPVITDFERPDGWYDQALSGVDEPYPYSLRFLENQEAWYTPFSRAGMLPPYDIRGWHGK
jgi:hypothetical protein